MARYKVIINTDKYKCHRCSQRNWEPGTLNDFMIALNGWHTTENNLREVMWRLRMFQGEDFLTDEWEDNPNTEYGLSDRYQKWLDKRCNTIKFFDRMCGFERKHLPSGYGWMQGYFSVGNVINELKQKGEVTIPFSWLYDLRQYDKNMNGCYMKITKLAKVNQIKILF